MKYEELIEEGIVIKAKNGTAEISIIESDSCDECSAKVYCNPSAESKKILKVKDPFGVKPGDKVRVSLRGSKLFQASLVLYGIPLILVLVGIFCGFIIFKGVVYNEVYSFVLGISLMCLYYLGIYIVTNKSSKKIELPTIIDVSSPE